MAPVQPADESVLVARVRSEYLNHKQGRTGKSFTESLMERLVEEQRNLSYDVETGELRCIEGVPSLAGTASARQTRPFRFSGVQRLTWQLKLQQRHARRH